MFKPASEKQEQFINSDSFLTVYGGAAGCLDADTEFLSQNGWKKISEYQDGDLVAEYNEDTDSVSFVKPKEYIKVPSTGFKRMTARGLDFALSGDHLVPYWKDKSKTSELKLWNDVLDNHNKTPNGFRHWIKTSFRYNGDGVDLTEGELRLQIAVQADGRIVKGGKNNYTQMRFSKKRKYDRLKWILDNWKLPYKDLGARFNDKYSNNTEYQIIVFPKYADKVFDSKYYKASQEQLEIVRDEVGHWDGTVYESGLVRYSTTVKENADFIQFAFHGCGYNSSFTVREFDNYKTQYQVDCVTKGNGFRSFRGKGYKQEVEEIKSKDGLQYCFFLDNGMFLARRNDCIFITQNSGKSFVGLMRFLLYIEDPNFFGYVFRLNATDMKGGGGLFQTACRMFKGYDSRVKYTKQPMCIYFPSGATINFTGLDGEAGLESIRGIEISAAMIDEGSQFDEDTIFWVTSRLRTKANMIPNLWITCNPMPTSFLCKWLEDYYLYPRGTMIGGELVEGRPNPEVDGDTRWFLRIGNDIKWGATKEEMLEKYGSEFPIDKRTGETTCKPRTFRFISASCHDNPPLLEADPNYVSNLLNMSRVEKERLYYGSWYAIEEGSGFFKRQWCEVVDRCEVPIKRNVRCWDIASTKPTESNPHPDYTASTQMGRGEDGYIYIFDARRDRISILDVIDWIADTAIEDQTYSSTRVETYIPQDPNAQAKYATQQWIMNLAGKGIPVRAIKASPHKSKLDKFLPFAAVAEAGMVKVVRGEWNEMFFNELESYTGGRSTAYLKDDILDTISDGFAKLATNKELPNFNGALLRL